MTTHSQAESTVFNDRLITVIDTPGISDLEVDFLLLTGLDIASDCVVRAVIVAACFQELFYFTAMLSNM